MGITTTSSNLDLVLEPHGDGQVRVSKLAPIDNVYLSGSTVSASNTDGDLVLAANGNGKVTVLSPLAISNLKLDGNTLSATNTDGNIELSPQGSGKVVTNSISSASGTDMVIKAASGRKISISSDLSIGDLTLSGDTVMSTDNLNLKAHGTGKVILNSPLSAPDGNDLTLSPSSGQKVIVSEKLQVDDLLLDGNILSTTDTSGDLILAPDGDGFIVMQSPTQIDNLKLDGNTLSSTNTNGDITLDPQGNGEVQVKRDLAVSGAATLSSVVVDNIKMDGNTISSLDTAGNINLSPASGKVVIDTIRGVATKDLTISPQTGQSVVIGEAAQVDNLRLDGNTLSSVGLNKDINLSPDGTGSVIIGTSLTVDDLVLDGRTITASTGDITLAPASGGSVRLNNAAIVDDITIDGSSITSTGDLTLSPASDSKVIMDKLQATTSLLGKITISGSTIETLDANTDLNLSPATGGKVKFDTATFSTDLTVDNVKLDGSTISSVDSAGNINLSPASGGKVVSNNDVRVAKLSVDNIEIDNNVITTTGTDTDLSITPVGSGKIVLGKATATSLTATNMLFSGNTISTIDTNGDLTLKPHGTGKVLSSATTDGNVQLTPSGTGRVVVDTAAVRVDNIKIDGNTISATDADGDINLSPEGSGFVSVSTKLQVGNLQFTGNTLSATDTSGNLELAPASNGKIIAGSINIATTASATTITQTTGDLTLSASAGNVALSPTSGKHVQAGNIKLSGNTITSSSNNDLTFNPPSASHVIMMPSGGSGSVGIGTSSPSSGSMLDVNGAASAKQYKVDSLSEAATGPTAFTGDSNYHNAADLDYTVTLTNEATVVVNYQLSHGMVITKPSDSSTKSVLGYMVTQLWKKECASASDCTSGTETEMKAARSIQGIQRKYNDASDDFGTNYVTNNGFLAESLTSGTFRFFVKYLFYVKSCQTAAGSTSSTFTCTSPQQVSTDGEGRSLQIMVLGAGHTVEKKSW